MKVRNYHESRQAVSAGKAACYPAWWPDISPWDPVLPPVMVEEETLFPKVVLWAPHAPPQINRKIKISVGNVRYFYWAKYKTIRTVCHAFWTWVHKNEKKPRYSKSTEHIAPNSFTAPRFSCFRACCVAAFFPFGSDQWEHNHPVSSGLAFET